MKKRIITILLAALVLTAQGAHASKFKFTPEYHNYNPDITLVVSKNHDEFAKAVHPYLTAIERIEIDQLKGFTVIVVSTKQCFVYVIEPKRESHFVNWGHELGHCVYGRFHTKLPKNVKVFE